jgi:hypothetical protein
MESIAEVCLHAVYGYNVPIDDFRNILILYTFIFDAINSL